MNYDVPLRFRRRLALEISELQETVGWEVTRTYLSFLSHAAEATVIERNHSRASSRPDRVDDEPSEAADEVWMTFLNKECLIDVTDAHSDSIEPLLIEHKLKRQLTSNQRRESRANTPSLAPIGETRTSSLAAEGTDAALCELCECNKCKQKRGKKRKREDSTESIIQAFPRPNLIEFLATHWKTLKEDGLYAGFSFESFQWTLKNGPANAHPLHHHLILRKLKIGDDLHQWRQSFAEIRNLESYHAFFSEVQRQRTTGKQARKRGEKDSDIAHKEYVAHIFEGRASPEELKEAKEDLKRDLQYGRLWSILVNGFADGDDGHCKTKHQTLKDIVKHAHQSRPDVVQMCQILQPATENLVYHHRLGDDDDWDDIALSLQQYLDKGKRRRLEKLPDHDGFYSFSSNAKAELRTYEGSDPDISSVAPERNTYARPGRLFERTESSAVDTTEPRSPGLPMHSNASTNEDDDSFSDSDGIQTISDNMAHPPNDNESNVDEDSCQYPRKELSKAALDCLLNLLLPTDEAVQSDFHIWPAIQVFDPLGKDDTAAWFPQTGVMPFNNSRYQLLPYFLSHHWQLAIFDMEGHIIYRYDSFWPDGVDRFPFVVLQQWLDRNGGNPDAFQYEYQAVKVGNSSMQRLRLLNSSPQETPFPIGVHDTGIITWWVSRQLISEQELDATTVDWAIERRRAAGLLRRTGFDDESMFLGLISDRSEELSKSPARVSSSVSLSTG